jgi:hypothetical protein
MLFETTIAGSLPKPAWLAEPNKLWAPWKQSGAALLDAKRDATVLVLKEQEDAGIDIVTEGEQSRQHFVHGFLEKIEGIDFANKVEMGIRNDRYKAMVPQVVGELKLKGRVHEYEARVARAHTRRKLKFTLPGPMTIIDTIADRHYGDRVKMAMAFAKLLNQEARALEADGVDVIQFDEPAFNVYMDEVTTVGHRRTACRCRRARLHHRRSHLLRLRHRSQRRLERDARRRVAPVSGYFPGAREKQNPAGFARSAQLQGPDRTDRTARRQRHPDWRDRCGFRPDRDAGRSLCRDRARHALCAEGSHLPRNQLRHGADEARDRVREARRPFEGRCIRAPALRLDRLTQINSFSRKLRNMHDFNLGELS